MDFKKHAGIDLHIHSTASDGTLKPSEILSLSLKLNLKAIAITDHDTVEGAREAIHQGIPSGLNFLTGVEISASPPSSFSCRGSFHILGYALNIDDPLLNQTLEKLQAARKNRNPQIIKRLNALGFNLSLEDVCLEGGDGQLGRPHIARVMIKKGYAHSIDGAFENYLGKGKPAYVDKYRLSSYEAINLIKNAGGIPALAHPYLLEIQSTDILEKLLIKLKEMGLKGLEVYYPGHTPDQVSLYLKLAKRHQLLMTGGTDFHGKLKPDIQIGSGRGNFFVPYKLYDNLINNRLSI